MTAYTLPSPDTIVWDYIGYIVVDVVAIANTIIKIQFYIQSFLSHQIPEYRME